MKTIFQILMGVSALLFVMVLIGFAADSSQVPYAAFAFYSFIFFFSWYKVGKYRKKSSKVSLRAKRELLIEQTELVGETILNSTKTIQDKLKVNDLHKVEEITFQMLLLSGFLVRKSLSSKINQREAQHIANELAINAVVVIGNGKTASEDDKRGISEGIEHLTDKFGSMPLKKQDGSATVGTFNWEYSKDLVGIITGDAQNAQPFQMLEVAKVVTDMSRRLKLANFSESVVSIK